MVIQMRNSETELACRNAINTFHYHERRIGKQRLPDPRTKELRDLGQRTAYRIAGIRTEAWLRRTEASRNARYVANLTPPLYTT